MTEVWADVTSVRPKDAHCTPAETVGAVATPIEYTPWRFKNVVAKREQEKRKLRGIEIRLADRQNRRTAQTTRDDDQLT